MSYLGSLLKLTLREFFVIRDAGQLLFHSKFTNTAYKDPFMTSGLIAAIFQFAQQVEHDTIDFIRMRQVSFSFRKSVGLIFVLTMESQTNPVHFESIMVEIETQFTKSFPEARLDDVIELNTYQHFTDILHPMLKPVAARAEFLSEIMWVLGIQEEKLSEWSNEDLSQSVARKILSIRFEELRLAREEGIEQTLEVIQELLQTLGLLSQINYAQEKLTIDCTACDLCHKHEEGCFCSGFIYEILSQLDLDDYDMEIKP